MDSHRPRESARHELNLQELGLPQLHQLAQRGSRRARAELERRLGAAPAPRPATSAAPPQRQPVPPPVLPGAAELMAARPAPPTPAHPHPAGDAALLDRLAVIERNESESARTNGPPRLVGMILLAWAAMLGFGGLLLAVNSVNFYYLFCAVGCAAAGYLLVRCSRWALYAHLSFVALALAWAWHDAGLALAALQASPLWIPALWIVVPQIREPLA